MWSWKAQYPPIFIPAHCEVNVICVVDEKYKALREVSQVAAFELWWGSSLDEASEYAHTDSFGRVPSTAHSVLLASSGILVSLFKILRWPSSIYSWHDVKTTHKGSQKAFRNHPGWQCVQTKMGLSCVLMNQKHTGNIFLNSYPCFQYGTRLDWARYIFFSSSQGCIAESQAKPSLPNSKPSLPLSCCFWLASYRSNWVLCPGTMGSCTPFPTSCVYSL